MTAVRKLIPGAMVAILTLVSVGLTTASDNDAPFPTTPRCPGIPGSRPELTGGTTYLYCTIIDDGDPISQTGQTLGGGTSNPPVATVVPPAPQTIGDAVSTIVQSLIRLLWN